jgi:adenylylsulfate kinase-like enzyme
LKFSDDDFYWSDKNVIKKNKIIFSVVQWYKAASTFQQQTILRELLAKLEKQFTQTALLRGDDLREYVRLGISYKYMMGFP